MPRRIVSGTKYEREIIELISSKTDFFGQRGTHSDGIDCIFFRRGESSYLCQAFRAEIKSSRTTVRYLSQDRKLMTQYRGYLRTLEGYNVMTFYFMRLIGHRRLQTPTGTLELVRPEDRWRVFRVDRLPLTRTGLPYLDFLSDLALTLDDFLDIITA